MKTFNDIREEFKDKDPVTHFKLELVGAIMAKTDRLGISQRELSRQSGVAQKTISRIYSGMDIPHMSTLYELAKVLNFTFDLNFYDNDNKEIE